MLGFIIAIVSGAMMSIQGVFNTEVTKSSSIWVTAGFVQLTALLACIVMWVFDGRPNVLELFSVERKYTLLGGVIGAFITFTVVKGMSLLGTAKASMTIVVAQLITSYMIELFGAFGSEKSEFSIMKLVGLALAIVGVVIFSMTDAGNS